MECSVFPATQDLLANLALPPDGPMTQMQSVSSKYLSSCQSLVISPLDSK